MESARELSNASGLDIVDAAAQLDQDYARLRYALVTNLLSASEQLMLAVDTADELEEHIPPLIREASIELHTWLRNLGLQLDEDD